MEPDLGGVHHLLTSLGLFFLTRALFCVSLVRFAYSPEFIKHFTCVVARAAVLE